MKNPACTVSCDLIFFSLEGQSCNVTTNTKWLKETEEASSTGITTCVTFFFQKPRLEAYKYKTLRSSENYYL
jgi:hypothetical protein